MAISTMQDDLDIISKLGDNPNTDNNLSEDQLRAKFDEGPNAIKSFLNNVIVPAINKLIGAVGFTGTHAELSGRDGAEQHPMGAITGLVVALGNKAPLNHDHGETYAPKDHDHDGKYLSGEGGTVNGAVAVTGNFTLSGGYLVGKVGVNIGTAAQRPESPPEGTVFFRIEE